MVWRNLAGMVRQVLVRQGDVWRGTAWQAWQGKFWPGMVVRGEGEAWHREVWEVNPYGRSHVMAAYKWKAGSRIKLDAQTAGEVCGELEKEGRLTPAELVEVSRDEAAPLHGAFEWRDEIAAEKYREVQAGHIIRSLEVVITGTSEPVRAYFPISIVGEGRTYTSTEVIMRTEDARAKLLERALAELEAFKRKYKTLGELADVFAAIDEVAQ